MNTPPPISSTGATTRLPGLWSWVTVMGVSLGLLLLFAALLVSLRLEKAMTDLVEARAMLVARQLADVVEGGLRFGVPLGDQTEAPRKMAVLSRNDSELLDVALLDEQGRPVVRQTAASMSEPGKLDARQVQRILSRKSGPGAEPARKVWLSGADIHVLVQVRDASGFASGAIWAMYSARVPQGAFAQSLNVLGRWAVVMTAGVTLLLGAMLWFLSRRATQAIGSPATAESGAWPLLPVPQALHTLAQLEAELAAMPHAPQSREAA